MKKLLFSLLVLLLTNGCASTGEKVAQGGEAVGRAAGYGVEAMHKTSEAGLEVIPEKKGPNPYNR